VSTLEPIQLALQLAAQEAAAAGYPEITTAHLVIALSRISEPDMEGQAAGAALREEFAQLGVEPRRFRRRLRALLGNAGAAAPAGPMHRSRQCRAAFGLAQALAAQTGDPPRLEHLLYGAVLCLAVPAPAGEEQGVEAECPACHARMRPALVQGMPHCAACGKPLTPAGGAAAPPKDPIPDEL
jgi:hypothetical protein